MDEILWVDEWIVLMDGSLLLLLFYYLLNLFLSSSPSPAFLLSLLSLSPLPFLVSLYSPHSVFLSFIHHSPSLSSFSLSFPVSLLFPSSLSVSHIFFGVVCGSIVWTDWVDTLIQNNIWWIFINIQLTHSSWQVFTHCIRVIAVIGGVERSCYRQSGEELLWAEWRGAVIGGVERSCYRQSGEELL